MKRVCLLLAAVLLVSFCGCGGGGKASPAPEPEITAAPTAAPTEGPTAGPTEEPAGGSAEEPAAAPQTESPQTLPPDYGRDWLLSTDGLSQLRILAAEGGEVLFGVSFFRLAGFTARAALDDGLRSGHFVSDDDMEFSGGVSFDERTITLVVTAAGPFSDELAFKTYVFVPMTEREEYSISQEELEEQIRWIQKHYYTPGDGDETVSVPAGADGWEYGREYRFHNGRMIFAFIFNGAEEHRLYFKDGHMIRYIDENHVTFDLGALDPFTEWEARALADANLHASTGSAPPGTKIRDDWLGTWRSAAGNILEIKEVTGTGIRVVHHHTGEQGEMLHTEYFMLFEDERQTVASEDVNTALTGWRYSLALREGVITLKSRYPDEPFYRQ